MILWPAGFLPLQFRLGALQETQGQLNWDFGNTVVKGLFSEVWAGVCKPGRMIRNVGVNDRQVEAVTALDLKGHGEPTGTHRELEPWKGRCLTVTVAAERHNDCQQCGDGAGRHWHKRHSVSS